MLLGWENQLKGLREGPTETCSSQGGKPLICLLGSVKLKAEEGREWRAEESRLRLWAQQNSFVNPKEFSWEMSFINNKSPVSVC